MAFPVTLNGRTYTLADFSGTAYVDGFPDALEDFVTHAGNTYLTTSTTSTALGTGSKTFTVADSGKPYASGTPLRISSSADETDYMDGLVTSYSGTTLTVNVVGFSGSGTLASWNINIGGGPITVAGTLPVNQGGTGATTASAAASALGLGTEDSPTFTGLTVTGTANFSDIDLSNVGDIALDSISSDSGGAIQVTLGTDAGDDFKVNNGSDVLLVEGDTSAVTIAGELTVKDIVMSDADTPKITMTDTTNTLTTFIQSGNSSSVIGTSTSHPLRLQTNSTDAIYVDTSQNVGLGGTPSHLLDIQRATNGTQARFIVNDGSINPRLMIYGSASGSHIQHTSTTGSKSLIFEIDGSEGSGTEAARIDGTRTLGVGTTNLLDANGYVGSNGAVYGQGFATANDRNDNAGFLKGLGITNGNNASTNNGLATGRLVAYVGGRTVTSDSNAGDDSGASLEFYTKGENAVLSRKMVLDSSGNLLVGTTSTSWTDTDGLRYFNGGSLISTLSGGPAAYFNRRTNDGNIAVFSKDGTTVGSIGSDSSALTFGGTSATTSVAVEVGGRFVVGKRSVDFNTNGATISSAIDANGWGSWFTATPTANGGVIALNRLSTDGTLIGFYQGGTAEGSITVSGTTVSYNGGHLARWSQLTDGTKDTSIVKGTVMTNLDQMAVWSHDAIEAQDAVYDEDGNFVSDAIEAKDAFTEDNEQLNCMAVSSVEGDTNVAGVFVNWDCDDQFNDMNVAMTGDMVIRIASGTTVARGDLLMSAGDGTAKPQGDDIVRSKTIAKVTSTHVSHTYDDNSYLVPVVLMAC